MAFLLSRANYFTPSDEEISARFTCSDTGCIRLVSILPTPYRE
jgi:hypothetical protein